jgi:septum site-determining protein MinC
MQVASFEIKSANLPLVSLLLKSPDLDRLSEDLQRRFGELPEFFDNDPLVIDLTPLKGEAEVDFHRLVAMLRQYRVKPVAVKGGSEGAMKKAEEAGLAAANEATLVVPASAVVPAKAGAQGAQEKPESPGSPPPRGRREDTLVIDKPLRSGQQVYAKGRDIVVMAMVNAGAEVIADGNIHVYAPLRGKAMAGARGNADARILTLCLEPELVSIAGVYRTSEVPLPPELHGKPAQIRLQGGADAGKLIIEGIPFK